MKLNEIITYCQLKDIIKQTHIISEGEMYGGGEHAVVSIQVAKDNFKHINIIYRTTGVTNAALVYAEIVYTKSRYLSKTKDEIGTANAKLRDIRNELFGYDYDH